MVKSLSPGATLLAGNANCLVQAAEISSDGGTFWEVQYHPELTLAEIAAALRRQYEDLLQQGVAPARMRRANTPPCSMVAGARAGASSYVFFGFETDTALASYLFVVIDWAIWSELEGFRVRRPELCRQPD